jgi:hypothetical protein
MRTFTYQFTVECASDGTANEAEVERLIDLNMQDLTFDDTFIEALDESEAVTIQVTRIG